MEMKWWFDYWIESIDEKKRIAVSSIAVRRITLMSPSTSIDPHSDALQQEYHSTVAILHSFVSQSRMTLRPGSKDFVVV